MSASATSSYLSINLQQTGLPAPETTASLRSSTSGLTVEKQKVQDVACFRLQEDHLIAFVRPKRLLRNVIQTALTQRNPPRRYTPPSADRASIDAIRWMDTVFGHLINAEGNAFLGLEQAFDALNLRLGSLTNLLTFSYLEECLEYVLYSRSSASLPEIEARQLQDSVMQSKMVLYQRWLIFASPQSDEILRKLIELLQECIGGFKSSGDNDIEHLAEKIKVVILRSQEQRATSSGNILGGFKAADIQLEKYVSSRASINQSEERKQDFKAALIDYLSSEKGLYQLLAKFSLLEWENSLEEGIKSIVQQHFSLENLRGLLRFAGAVRSGIDACIEPNADMASKFIQLLADLSNEHYPLTILSGDQEFTDLISIENFFDTDLKGKKLRCPWYPPNGIEGTVTQYEPRPLFIYNEPFFEGKYTISVENEQSFNINMGFKMEKGKWIISWSETETIYHTGNAAQTQISLSAGMNFATLEHVHFTDAGGIPKFPVNRENIYQLSDTVTTVAKLTEIRKMMGNRLFSYEDIYEHFNLKVVLPRLPDRFETSMLLSPCPFEPNKKICETHFLYPIPVHVFGKPNKVTAFATDLTYSLKPLVDGFLGFKVYGGVVLDGLSSQSGKCDGLGTELGPSSFWNTGTEYPILKNLEETYGTAPRWILAYGRSVSPVVGAGYERVSVQEFLLGYLFSRVKKTNLSTHFDFSHTIGLPLPSSLGLAAVTGTNDIHFAYAPNFDIFSPIKVADLHCMLKRNL